MNPVSPRRLIHYCPLFPPPTPLLLPQFTNGTVHVKATYDKSYELILNPLQAAVLLPFADSEWQRGVVCVWEGGGGGGHSVQCTTSLAQRPTHITTHHINTIPRSPPSVQTTC